jgi:hypothetical protein
MRQHACIVKDKPLIPKTLPAAPPVKPDVPSNRRAAIEMPAGQSVFHGWGPRI